MLCCTADAACQGRESTIDAACNQPARQTHERVPTFRSSSSTATIGYDLQIRRTRRTEAAAEPQPRHRRALLDRWPSTSTSSKRSSTSSMPSTTRSSCTVSKRAVLGRALRVAAAQAHDRRDLGVDDLDLQRAAEASQRRKRRMTTLKITEAQYRPVPDGEARRRDRLDRPHPDEAEAKRRGRANMLFPDELEDKLLRVQPVADRGPGARDRRDHRGAAADHRGQPRGAALDAWRAAVVRRGREAPPSGAGRRLRRPRATTRCTSRGSGRSSRWRAQGQPRRRHVRRQRPPGGHRRAQEPEGRRRARRGQSSSCAATRWRRPSCSPQPQLFNVTHLLDYWYGVTWNANRRFIFKWKHTEDEEYRFAVQAFFEPTDFLRTLQHWILFYVEDGETRKSVLREHQRRAIDKIVARCADPTKTRGLIWHTQGSGKTFTLLTAARLILEDKDRFSNAHRHPRRRPHRAGGAAQGVGRPAAR